MIPAIKTVKHIHWPQLRSHKQKKFMNDLRGLKTMDFYQNQQLWKFGQIIMLSFKLFVKLGNLDVMSAIGDLEQGHISYHLKTHQ